MRLPSIKTLKQLEDAYRPRSVAARLVRRVLEAARDGDLSDVLKTAPTDFDADAYCRRTYHLPSKWWAALEVADHILGTHGVECVRVARDGEGHRRLDYLNAGDAYRVTLATEAESWNEFGLGRVRSVLVASWGDWVESMERQGWAVER